jgi:hypothetical protein
VRWPIREAVEVKSGSRETVKCQVGRFNLQNQQIELLYEVDYLDNVHQINIFSDRYLVFTSFKQRLNVPYPETSINDDPDGYRASHAAGLKLTDMVTVDLKTRSHWFTTIPVPVPAHFEEDPVEENVFYVSAHNLVNHRGEVLLEGPAALFKIRIDDHNNVIAGAYSEENLYRATSHRAFRYRHKTLLAVTNVPNRLDLIDADKMELWRRIELRKATSYNFTKTGNALCNLDPGMYLSLVTSKDGRYVILESLEDLAIYDTEKNALLPARIHSYPAEGYIRYGHCVEVKN